MVQFFRDPDTFVAIETRADLDYRDQQLSEVGRGAWPYPPVAAWAWSGHAPKGPSCRPEFEWPFPYAVLLDTGAIVVWQFDRGFATEETFSPFTVLDDPRGLLPIHPGLVALFPDGSATFQATSDCEVLQAPALAPQILSPPPVELDGAPIRITTFLGSDTYNLLIAPRAFTANDVLFVY